MSKPKACILVVDDEKVLVDSIEALFTYCGFEVIKATDPERALALSDEIKPDVIIADIRMPKLDGITFLKKFKDVQPEVKVITMTGYYSDYMKSIKQAIDSGLADRVIQKPFSAFDLEKLVYDVLKSPEEEIEFSSASKGKVLFVDDEVDAVVFLKDYFRERGYSAATATDAEEAVAMCENFDPHVVVTDIKMPGRDGFWLIKEVRSQKKRKIPAIIVMTGQDDHKMLRRLKEEAAIEKCFAKPFGLRDLEELRGMIDAVVKAKK